MKFRNLHNATTLIESNNIKLLFDPWLIGGLYNGAWSITDNYASKNKYFTKDISHIFISHIHQDHWDIDTLKCINKNAKVLMPNYGFNNIIKNRVQSIGFNNIGMLEVGIWFNITSEIRAYIIPPLNGMAQDIEWYEKKGQHMPIAIDTGLIIEDKISQTSHVILGDNTPYDINLLTAHLPDATIDSFWFPYNGFAQDYPLCYDNLSINEKKVISLNMSIKREQSLLKVIDIIKPKCLIPYSSDFVLNGPKKSEFNLIHSNEFLDKNKYANRIKKLTCIKSYGLYAKDFIEFTKNNVSVSICSTAVIKTQPVTKLNIPIDDGKENILYLLEDALFKMQQRCNKLNIPIQEFSNWTVVIQTERNAFLLCFKNWHIKQLAKDKITELDNAAYILKLITTENIIRCILSRKLHFNNCNIGCFLTWERTPNVFNKYLYDALNFLHL